MKFYKGKKWAKKDRLLDRLKSWHSHSEAITAFMALAGFTFTSAGGVIAAPTWLIVLGAVIMVLCGFSFIFIQKKIARLQKELGEMKWWCL